MRAVFCLFVVALLANVHAKPTDDDHYTTKYDNVDLEAIIKNDRLLRAYVDCLLSSKKCTKDGEELKKVLPDALKTGCSKCNDTQKGGARKILHHLIENKKEWYKELEAIFDSEGIYKKKYTEEAKKEGLSI